MSKKDSIVLYGRQRTAISRLSYEQKGKLFDALLSYASDGENFDFGDDIVTAVAFDFFRAQIDTDADKYNEICKKRSDAGKKHRGNQYSKNGTNGTNGANVPKVEQMELNDNDNDNNRETNVSQKTIKTKKRENLENYEKPSKEENDRFIGLLKRYNAVLSEMDSNINRVVMLTPYRVERLRRLVLDFSDEQIERGFKQAAASSYLNGRTAERTRPADFDWIIDFDNFVKIYEGGVC